MMAKKAPRSYKETATTEKVTVYSRAYGVHTRAARGSKTPATLNAAMTEHARKTAKINSVAKRVHDLLKLCSPGFKESMLWQVMLSRMRKAATDKTTNLLVTLKGLELNEKYPLQRFITSPQLTIETGKNKWVVSFKQTMAPFIKNDDPDYGYEMMLLVLGNKPENDTVVTAHTEWTDKTSVSNDAVFYFKKPDKVKHYLLCLHFMSGKDGKATGTLASRAMQIAGVEKV